MLLGIRTAPKEDFGCSAAEMVYGAPLTVPGDFILPVHADGFAPACHQSGTRSLHVLQSIGKLPTHRVCLNMTARADITWWHVFTRSWNGTSMLWDLGRMEPEVWVYSDVAGGCGCGAYCLPHWLALKCPPSLVTASIQVKELIPVVLAAAIYERR